MSEEKKGKNNFLEKPTSRREFLKKSVIGAAGAAFSVSFLSMFTDSAEAEVLIVADGIVISDPVICTGCRRCETNCTAINDNKAHPYISRVKVGQNYNYGLQGPAMYYWTKNGQMGDFTIIAETCRQCESPRCAAACPMGAITADPDTGARVINTKKCVGCGNCVTACPYDIPTIDPEINKSTKCNLCEGEPTCVAGCPTGSLKFVSWDKVERTLIERERIIKGQAIY
ncbi:MULTISPECIES: 4Fe-4S dicluster domain-containing protein [unclassified Halanaerobium]|uniref:4Fe-4S dicluster domain-containing protein n=1 Tax=unclassified Halanaerobium TaxID=2641197 RepID=UPI000DF2E4B2|nr:MULTISPECIES: 4Fe-4S dicluster domain-containing protein [unclassified Halanaerobium]RCW40621.1 secreted protein [Halanaerobium sp. MA284_MarDTE_T2]RCW87995.1 secreted protein [Halanaerobium sp. DL-01]